VIACSTCKKCPMPNPRKPFRINVGFIVHEEIGFTSEFTFDVDRVEIEDLTLRNVRGVVHVGRTQQGLVVQGNFSGDITLECVRCLKDFSHHLELEFTELYAFNNKSVSESGLILPESAQIDLAPLVREYALLEVPISPIHDPDCKGLCIECGQDLNIRDCGHNQHPDESPFSELKNLLN
jgi:uncharacterized protein